MLAAVGSWIKVLVMIVVLGQVMEFLLPKGSLKQYAGLVVGLVLLLAMISPVWHFVKGPQALAGHLAETAPQASTGSHLIQHEEIAQAEVMALNFPGVVQCRIETLSSGSYRVVVKTSQTINLQHFQQFIQGALTVCTGHTVKKVHVQVTSTPHTAEPPLKRQVSMP